MAGVTTVNREQGDEVTIIRQWMKLYGIGPELGEWLRVNGDIGSLGSTWNMATAIVDRGLASSFWTEVKGKASP